MQKDYMFSIPGLIDLMENKLHLSVNKELFEKKIRNFAVVNELLRKNYAEEGIIQLRGNVNDESGINFDIDFSFNKIFIKDCEVFIELFEIKLDSVQIWSQ